MGSLRSVLRRKATWTIATVLLLYIVTGFFVVPPVAKRQIVKNVAENLGREVSIERVRFNPLVLSLSLRGLSFKDPDGYEFIGFDQFYVDFQVSSLFRWAYTFKEVRLDSLRTHVRLMPDGKANFADIAARLEARARTGPGESQSSVDERKSVPRLLIGDLKLNGARLWATNLTVREPEVVAFTPVDLELFDFTTIPNKEGDYAIGAKGPEGGSWRWKGSVTFDPPSSAGSFSIAGGQLEQIWEIAKNRVAFEITEGELGLSLDYSVEARGDTVVASISNGALSLDRFTLREKGREPDLFTLDSLRVTGLRARYPEQDVSIERVFFGGADVLAWLRPTRELNWLSLFPPMPSDSANGGANEEPPGTAGVAGGVTRDTTGATQRFLWKMAVAEVAVEDLSFVFMDSTTTPPFRVGIDPLDLTLRGLSSEPGAEFTLDADLTIEETGKLAVEGAVAALPPHARVKAELRDLPLPIFQPYIEPLANLEVTSGTLDVTGAIEISEMKPGSVPVIRFEGTAGSKDFLTKDSKRNEALVSWRSLDAGGISFGPEKIHVSEIGSAGAYARIIIYPDRTTNLAAVFAPSAPEEAASADTAGAVRPPRKAPPPIPIAIDRVTVADCTADFSDLSLILPFTAAVYSLGGDVRGLSSVDTARAAVSMEGSVKPSGSVTVKGEINPLRGDLYTDLSVIFRDFDLPALTPYSGHFIGREIDKGKLMLDLKYRVAERELLGENKIVIDQLELGRDIESPDATSLPVGLAVALLKNRDGVIDLDIPVKGNLDDPKFGIMDAVLDVLVNIVTKAVMAPFALLGRLVGFGGGDEMSHVDFDAGTRALASAEHEKVAKLGEALAERPELRLDVRGRWHPEADSKAIRQQKFAAIVTERIQGDPKKYAPAEGAAHPVKLLRDLYAEHSGKDAVRALEERFQVPKIGKDGKPKDDTMLDEAAFCAEIERVLTDLQTVTDEELQALALDRAMSIKEALIGTAAVDPARIFFLDTDDQAEFKDERIRLELKLTD